MSRLDSQLDAFLGESKVALEHRAATTRRSADFMDVMRRANLLDSGAVSDDMMSDAAQLAPVVDIRTSTDAYVEPDPQLDGFLGEVKDALEQRVADRQLAPIPALRPPVSAPTPTPTPAEAAGPRRAVVGSVLGLLAAAVIGWLALGEVTLLTPAEPETLSEQSVNLGATSGETGGDVIERGIRSAASSRGSDDAVDAPTEDIAEVVEVDEDVEVEVPEEEPSADATPRRPLRDGLSRDERLRQILETAKAQWQAGQPSAAKATLRRLIKIGGRSRHVQSAYADLFVLSHQAGNEAERRRLWRAYVRRFPHGRYADDARAGLCRTAKQPTACWRDYLDDFARGSYRAEANRALRRSGQGAE